MTSIEAIESLPRFPVTAHLLESHAKCEVCQETFAEGEEICALPCIHHLYIPLWELLILVIPLVFVGGWRHQDRVRFVGMRLARLEHQGNELD